MSERTSDSPSSRLTVRRNLAVCHLLEIYDGLEMLDSVEDEKGVDLGTGRIESFLHELQLAIRSRLANNFHELGQVKVCRMYFLCPICLDPYDMKEQAEKCRDSHKSL